MHISIACLLWSIGEQTDAHENHVTINFFTSLLYKTNRFHAAQCLLSNRSHKTSKLGKNISDTLA